MEDKNMSKRLKQITKEWMELERRTFEQRAIADRFYDEHLMSLIEGDFIRRNKEEVFEKVHHLVMSVGTSYEPIVLNLKLLKPEHVLFLYTEKSEQTLEKVVSYCELSPRIYEKRKISEVEPMEIYRIVKQIYLYWENPERMYIDFTGGTKAMAVAAALAGTMIDVQMIYVASDDYLVDFRKPRPGSEKLIYIENPMVEFGDMEIDKAFTLFRKYNFAGAAERLELLKETIPEPDLRQQLNFAYLLARCYEQWDSLAFEEAAGYATRLCAELDRDRKTHRRFLLMDCVKLLHEQKRMLEELRSIPGFLKERQNMEILRNGSVIHALMFTMLQNAETRREQEKYDMATLLLYRLLEMIEQRRLSHYGLYASDMDYNALHVDRKRTPEAAEMSAEERLEWLKNENFAIKQALFPKSRNAYLPDQIALLDGFMLLAALRDPLMEVKKGTTLDLLKRIRANVGLRNHSIFAHGLGPVGKEIYLKFELFVKEMFRNLCQLEKVDYEAYREVFRWIQPLDSDYYGKGEK